MEQASQAMGPTRKAQRSEPGGAGKMRSGEPADGWTNTQIDKPERKTKGQRKREEGEEEKERERERQTKLATNKERERESDRDSKGGDRQKNKKK